MIPGGPTFGVTKRLQKWPRYFAHKDLQRGAETDASSIEVRDTAYRTQAATKRTVYSSFLGYCLRCYGEPIAAWLCALTPALPPLPRQLVIGLHSVQSALIASNPFNPEPFSDSFQRFIFAGLNHSTLSHKLTSLLKRHLTRRLFHQTRNFLLQRNAQVPWAWQSTPALFDALHCTPNQGHPLLYAFSYCTLVS